jgi:Skp family chaperone for outer membrane proteins
MPKSITLLLAALIFMLLSSCTRHRVEVAPVEIKPIHITIDVNVKVEKALDDFFGKIDAEEQKIETPSSTKQ